MGRKVLLKKSHSNRIIDILILYFVPVFPYGLIAYIASRSKLRFIPYSLITTLGALPSIILSTSLTGSILSGNLILTVVLVGVAIVGISGMIVFRIIYVRKSKKGLQNNGFKRKRGFKCLFLISPGIICRNDCYFH